METETVYQNLQETRSPCYGQEAVDVYHDAVLPSLNKGTEPVETDRNLTLKRQKHISESSDGNDVYLDVASPVENVEITSVKEPSKKTILSRRQNLSQKLSTSSNLSEMYLTIFDPDSMSGFADPVYDNYKGPNMPETIQEEEINLNGFQNDGFQNDTNECITLESHIKGPPDTPFAHEEFDSFPIYTPPQEIGTRTERNSCLLYVSVFLASMIAIVAFLLALFVYKGILSTECTCKTGLKQELHKYIDEQVARLDCPVGWFRYDTSCYGMTSVGKANFSTAKASCGQYGGYLVSLETEEENNFFLKNILCPRFYHSQDTSVYLGLHSNSTVKVTEYVWESKTQFKFSNFPVSHSNNSVDSCFQIDKNGTWIRTNCGWDLSFYCERTTFERKSSFKFSEMSKAMGSCKA